MKNSSLNDLSIGTLRTLLVLAEEGNATRTAFRLGVSQSAVSHSLARLRRAFGDPLFIRSRGGMILSARGADVVARVRALLEEIDGAVGGPAFDPAQSDARFTIAVPDHLIAYLMPRVVARLSDIAPRVRLLIHTLHADSPAAVEDNEVDLVVTAQMQTVAGSLRQRILLYDSFCVVCTPEHPFATSPGLDGFLASDHVAFPLPSSQSLIDRALRRHGAALRNRRVETTSLLSAMSICRASPLLATVPANVAREFADAFGLTYHSMPFEMEPVVERAYWHPARHGDRAHAWLRQVLADTAREAGYAGGPA